MAAEGIRQAVRLPITFGWRRAALLFASALLLLVVYAAVRVTGGAPNPLVHFAYIAIALAALSAGWRGGLLAGLAAGLLLGPLMPDSTAASVSDLGQWGWALRLSAYLLAGGIIGVFWDRSQRLAGVVAERAADARGDAVLRRTVEAAADGLLVFDAAGRLGFCNAPAERLLGLPRAELLGATYGALAAQVGLDARGSPDGPTQRPAAAAGPRAPLPPTLVSLRGPDGTQRTLQVSSRPLDADGSAGGLVFSLHEVTADHALARERSAHLAGLQAAAQAAAGAPSAAAAAEALLAKVARIWPVVATAIYLFDERGTQRLAVWSAPEAGPTIPPLVPTDCAAELRALAAGGPLRTDLARLPGTRAREPRSSPSAARMRSWCFRSSTRAPWWAPCWPAIAGGPSRSAPTRRRTCRRSAASRRASCAARWRTRRRPTAGSASGSWRCSPPLSCWRRRTSPSSIWPPAGWSATRPWPASAPSRCSPPTTGSLQAAGVGLGAELQALAIERERTVAAAAGLPTGTFLSLNVSPRYLTASPVAAALAGGSLGRLVIEVTEEEAVADYAALRRAMAPYLARGARVAVDDAGAGYASMRHVTELRPAFVKLDAELIRGLGDDTARQALLHALVSFTAAIEAVPIAEGVETPADLALLARTRAPLLAQGYAIARPGPAWPAIEPAALGAAAVRRSRALPVALPAQPGRM